MAFENIYWHESTEGIVWLKNKIQEAIKQKIIQEKHFSPTEWTEIHLFLKDDHLLLHYYHDLIEKKKHNTIHHLSALKNKNFIIFGCGKLGKKIKQHFTVYSLSINAFCDNDKNKWGKNIDGVSVISPIHAVERYSTSSFIIANKLAKKEIYSQLLSLGVKQDQIYEECQPFLENISVDLFTLRGIFNI